MLKKNWKRKYLEILQMKYHLVVKDEVDLSGNQDRICEKINNEKYMKTEHPYFLQEKAKYRVFVSCYVLGNLIQLCFNLLTLFFDLCPLCKILGMDISHPSSGMRKNTIIFLHLPGTQSTSYQGNKYALPSSFFKEYLLAKKKK